jgi:hypothetical protein
VDLDAADFDDAVTAERIQTRCFGIKDDLAHNETIDSA